MSKIVSILSVVVFVCFSCSQSRERSSRFSEDQIAQLCLNDVKPLVIFNNNSLKLNINDFMKDNVVFISEFVDSIRFIQLQTTKESLIGGISKLISVDKYFFILDFDIGKNVLIFSDDGSFIKKINTGQGPQEIFRPQDIAVDEDQQHLIVYHRTGLSFYDYRGDFVKKELVPFYFNNFRVLSDGYLFISNPQIYNIHLRGVSEMQVFITDKKFRIISAGLPFHYSKSLNYSINDYTSSLGKKVNFAFKFSNKVYEYVDTLSVKEKYQLDFSKKGLPEKYLEMDTREVLKALKDNDYYFFMGDYIENDTHEFMLIRNHSKKVYHTLIFRDKMNGKLQGGNMLSPDNDHNLLFAAPLTAYKSEFIGGFEASYIHFVLSELQQNEKYKMEFDRMNALFSDLKEDANPVLVKYKLKNFN